MTAEPNISNSPKPANADEQVPLVVDLDGTLSRTDTLHEGVLALVARDPQALLSLPAWLREGRAGFKARLADRGVLEANALPLNDAVIGLVEAARAEGRPT